MTNRVVFDCMIFLQGAASSQGPAALCLHLAELGHVELCVSSDVLNEIRDVLTRPQLQRRFSALTAEAVAAFLSRLNRFAHVIDNVQPVVSLPRDPKDEKYLNLAVAAGAVFLVSRDNDLLDLMDEQKTDGRAFRMRFPHITILDPVAFLETLQAPSERLRPDER